MYIFLEIQLNGITLQFNGTPWLVFPLATSIQIQKDKQEKHLKSFNPLYFLTEKVNFNMKTEVTYFIFPTDKDKKIVMVYSENMTDGISKLSREGRYQ